MTLTRSAAELPGVGLNAVVSQRFASRKANKTLRSYWWTSL
jgi:hypothetical protein